MIRSVLDTNILVSALIKPSSIPGRLIELLLRDAFRLIWSVDLINETTSILLQSEKVRSLISISDEDIMTFIHALELIAVIPSHVPKVAYVVRDAKDNMVLDCAFAGNANYIVTGDKDLLVIENFQDIRIVTPREFFTIISSPSHS